MGSRRCVPRGGISQLHILLAVWTQYAMTHWNAGVPSQGRALGPLSQRPSRRWRLVLADDHAIVAAGVQRLLEPECEVLAVVPDGAALVDAVRTLQPDIVVTDLSMPGISGIDAVRAIKRNWPQTRVICLSMHQDRTWLSEALDAGASGYVIKHGAAEELQDAIRMVQGGGVYISPALDDRHLASRLQHSDPLTTREREVLRLIAQGLTLKHVAAQLRISPKTVEFHKSRIRERLGLRTTAELVQYAIRHEMLAE